MVEETNILFNNNDVTNEIYINEFYVRHVKSIIPEENGDFKWDETKPKTIVSKIQTPEFIKRLNLGSDGEILPKNCRYVQTHGAFKVYVIEDQPILRTINVAIRLDSEVEELRKIGKLEKYGFSNFLKDHPEPPYKMQVSFPYIEYILLFDAASDQFVKLYTFYRLHPLTSLDDYLLNTNLLNVSENGAVCLGDNRLNNKYNINDRIEHIIDSFWANEFNGDITVSYNFYKEEPEISTFLSWKYHTKVDPMFIFDVKWKRYLHNLKQTIQFLTNSSGAAPVKSISKYISLISSDFDQKAQLKTNRFSTLNSIPLFDTSAKGKIYLEVGCELEIDEKKYYVYSILNNGSGPVEVELEDEKGELTKFKLENEFLTKVKKYYTDSKLLKSFNFNGLEIVPGTVLEYSNSGYRKLKKVTEINKSRDGKIEIRTSSGVFIIDDKDLIGLKLFDLNDVSFKNGLKSIKGNKYTLIGNDNYSLYPLKNVLLKDISVGNDNIIYTFEMIPSKREFRFNDSNYFKAIEYNEKLMTKSEVPVFRAGTSILTNNSSARLKFNLFEDGIGVSDGATYSIHDAINTGELENYYADIALIKQEIMKDNKFTLKSFDLDIEFSVGDNVVIADYSRTLDYITKIRTIIGFKFENNRFYIVTMTEDNIKEDVPYINFNAKNPNSSSAFYRNPTISIGLVRKIIPELGYFKRGMKIQAKEKSIPMFLKKDVHEIVGIIVDTGYKPVILCSNGHTIWCDDKSKELFTFITEKSKKYKTLQTTKIEVPIIKYQAGDLIRNEYINMFHAIDSYRGRLSFIEEEMIHNAGYPGKLRKVEGSCYYQTIPMPRFNETSLMKNNVHVIPNYHGWFTIKPGGNTMINMEEI